MSQRDDLAERLPGQCADGLYDLASDAIESVGELEARVAELESLVGEGEAERTSLRKYNSEYREQLIELKAASKPRPMSEALFYTGMHRHSFRPGESAEVVGASMFTPKGLSARPVLVVRYADGTIDEVAMGSTDYRLSTRPDNWRPLPESEGGA